MILSSTTHELVLTGLDDANPLGFLAAPGTLRTSAMGCPNPTPHMSRRSAGGWRPVLHSTFVGADALTAKLHNLLTPPNKALTLADDPGMPARPTATGRASSG